MAEENFGSLGWIKDHVDFRDKTYAISRADIEIPKIIDLRTDMSAIEDQGRYSSCAACSIVGALEFLQIKKNKAKKKKLEDSSRMFVYYNARMLDQQETKDAGCKLRSAIKSVVDYGSCREKSWPYIEKNVFKKPGRLTYWMAKKNLVKDYCRIENPEPNTIKYALAEGYPIVFGSLLFESFGKTKKDGIVPLPDPQTEKVRGGHAMLICGYTETHFIVRNSWGSWWGDKGYCYVPEEYFKSMMFLSIGYDFWVIRDV